MIKIKSNVLTYVEGEGHKKKKTKVSACICDNGVTINLGNGSRPLNLFLEKRKGCWALVVTPKNSEEISAQFILRDDGTVQKVGAMT